MAKPPIEVSEIPNSNALDEWLCYFEDDFSAEGLVGFVERFFDDGSEYEVELDQKFQVIFRLLSGGRVCVVFNCLEREDAGIIARVEGGSEINLPDDDYLQNNIGLESKEAVEDKLRLAILDVARQKKQEQPGLNPQDAQVQQNQQGRDH